MADADRTFTDSQGRAPARGELGWCVVCESVKYPCVYALGVVK